MRSLRVGEKAILGLLLMVLGACGGSGQGGQAPGAKESSSSSRRSDSTVSKADADEVERLRELTKIETASQVKQISGVLDTIEKELVHILSSMLAQEPYDRGKGKIAMSSCIATLRQAGMKITIVPITDLKGAFTIDEKGIKAFYAKNKRRLKDPEQEAFNAITYMLGSYSAMISQAQQYAMMTHLMVVAHAATVAGVTTNYNVPTNDADIEVVRKAMTEERRAETMAAASAGLGAAIQAILDKNKDPKALDEIAKAFISGTPIKATVTAAEAKTYLEGFQSGVGDTRARYAAMLDQYMPGWKDLEIGRYFNETFKAAEAAGQKRARPGERGERADRGDKSSPKSEGSAGKSAEALAAGAASQAANGALGSATKLLTSDERIKHGLQAYEALRKGDAKGTATAALTFVPDGPVKNGLGLVLKLF